MDKKILMKEYEERMYEIMDDVTKLREKSYAYIKHIIDDIYGGKAEVSIILPDIDGNFISLNCYEIKSNPDTGCVYLYFEEYKGSVNLDEFSLDVMLFVWSELTKPEIFENRR